MKKSHVPALVVAVIVAATRLRAMPRSLWTGEEVGFVRALLTFDPMQHQPDAPAYPLTVGLGKLVNAFVHEPFTALVVLSVISSIAGAVMMTFAFARILDDEWSGAAAATLLYLSPALLVFTPLPNAEAVSMAFVAATLLTFARGDGALFGICAGAAVAARPQLFVAALLLVLFARRGRIAFLATLAITFEPVIEAITPSYLRTHVIERGTFGVAHYIAHPWGPKFLALPLLALAVFGVVRKRDSHVAGVALFAVAHLAFCVFAADRASGVQPLLPSLVAIALFAAAPLRKFAMPVALAYGVGALMYVEPLVRMRGTESPAAAATAYAARSNAVVIYDPAMEPFARNAGFRSAPLASLDRFAVRADIPLVLLTDGGADAKTFAWPDSDAYGKVTAEHYRVVSVVPLPPATRYIADDGVYQFERTNDGRAWRWLAPRATIHLPPATRATVTLALPPDAADNRVTIDMNGVAATTVDVRRGSSTVVDLAVPERATLTFRSAHSFTPPGEQRTLAVQLLGVEHRSAGVPPAG